MNVRLRRPLDVTSRRPQDVRLGRPWDGQIGSLGDVLGTLEGDALGTSWGPIFAGCVAESIGALYEGREMAHCAFRRGIFP